MKPRSVACWSSLPVSSSCLTVIVGTVLGPAYWAKAADMASDMPSASAAFFRVWVLFVVLVLVWVWVWVMAIVPPRTAWL